MLKAAVKRRKIHHYFNGPAFLFYPGDYLRDTQCLSEICQVAYDRIMCEHMRNICISKTQLNFFTKRLNDEEKKELIFLLKEIPGGYQIEWVADSIAKRQAYSESRRNNKVGKLGKKPKNISSLYVTHMENENENENEDVNKNEISEIEIGKTIQYLKLTAQITLDRTDVLKYWEAFLINTEKEFYPDESKKLTHFRNWLKMQKHKKNEQPTNTADRQANILDRLKREMEELAPIVEAERRAKI